LTSGITVGSAFGRAVAWPAKVVIFTLAAISAILLFRAGWARVIATSDGIRIINPFGSRTFPWGEIREFSLARYRIFASMGQMRLKDGTTYHLFAIQPPNRLIRPRNTRAEEMIAELNRLSLS